MRVVLFLLIFCFGGSLMSQTPQVLPKKILKKGFPGVVPLQDDFLFIDETEVSNGNWKEFLYWLYKNDTSEYRKMLPDTQVWYYYPAYNASFVEYYLQHPAYHDYPVVGISYDQAQSYSKWRTDRVIEYLKLKKHPIKKLVYRLPSEAEWKKAAWGTLPAGSMWPWEEDGVRWKGSKRKIEGMLKLNFNIGLFVAAGLGSSFNNQGTITTPVYSYWPNTIGTYNMCGNVAEWTEEHKAIGGSWNDYGYHCQITTPKPILHDSTTLSTVGFRCVMEILEYEDEFNIKPIEINSKKIEKQMKSVRDTSNKLSIYVSETEVTNQEYLSFLNEINDSNHLINNQNWAKHTRYKAQKLYGWHEAYSNYPVVNIEYKDAIAYCDWLSKKYNSSEKRKYKKVRFKLPTLMEWKNAAAGGRPNNVYPWGGIYSQNSKGRYIANFSPLEPQYLDSFIPVYYFDDTSKYKIENGDTLLIGPIPRRTKKKVFEDNSFDSSCFGLVYSYPNNDKTISRKIDGSYYPARVTAYFPNDYGLYNMAGNVSEMLSEKGKAKGGNWTSSQYEIQINAPTETYTQANCLTGFRVFMEVLEK